MKAHSSVREFQPCKNPECIKTIEINGWGFGKKMKKRRSGYCRDCQLKKHALEQQVKRLQSKSIPEIMITKRKLMREKVAITARIKRIENVTIKKFEERIKEKQRLLERMKVERNVMKWVKMNV